MIKGCVAVPIDPDQLQATLRICVVVRLPASSAPATLIQLRDQLDSRIYLGCVTDLAGTVQQWIEIWVQDLTGLQQWALSHRTPISNAVLDDGWQGMQLAFAALDATSIIQTGWETAAPPPVLIDVKSRAPLPFQSDTKSWVLCTDDLLLQTQGLPAYSSSLHRFLYHPGKDSEARFMQVLPLAPVQEPAAAMVVDPALLSFNPTAGRLLIRDLSAIDFESVIDVLSDGTPAEIDPAHDPAGEWQKLRGVMDDLSPDGRLLAPHLGHEAKLLEYLHLRIHLITDAVRAVRAWTAATKRPMLNVNAASFAVRFGDPGAGLPLLWTGRAILRTPGSSVESKVPGSNFIYYQAVGLSSSAVFTPAINTGNSGIGNVRITGVRTTSANAAILELKLVTQERIFPSADAMVFLRLSLMGQRIDLHAKFQDDPSLAPGEYRLRTVEQQHAPAALAVLSADAGTLIPNVMFDIFPLLDSPCDLYSLGVLAIRSLLTNHNISLPEALDRMISFSQHLARQGSGSMTENDVALLFASESRWYEWLGPQQLSNVVLKPAQAFDVVPTQLWYSVLVTIARMLTGISPVSEFQSLGQTTVGAAHRVFDQTIDRLERLLLRTRSLLVVDWHSNRELSRVIRKSMRSASLKR